MVIPAKARKAACIRKGDVLEVQPEGKGRIVLVRLEKPNHQNPVKILKRRGTYSVAYGRTMTSEQVKELLNEIE
jgi:bifunctional DNA-binding transcriptional regulator/antitoxin component of YhaV-PrlF toxin-antitoxin module